MKRMCSTNINITNNHLSPKISEQKKDHDNMTFKIQVLYWDRHNNTYNKLTK